MTPALSRFINCARWMAATFVAMHHVHNIFINQADIMTAPHAPPVYVWWFFTPFAFAHGAVVIFFVLSGFLVGGTAIERVRAGKPFLRNYLIDRTSRIYTVLLPTLVLCFVMDMSGRIIFANLNVYEQSFYHGLFEPRLLLTSIPNLQGIWYSTFGTDMALWSLGMEYWYYIVFALIILPFSQAYSSAAKTVSFILGLGIFAALALSPTYFFFGFFLWCVGAAVRLAPRPLMRSKWLALLLWASVLTIQRLTVRGPALDLFPTKHMVDAVNALLFGNILLTLRFDHGEGFSFCRARFHLFLSEFSFTLYAVHMPLLVWLWAITVILFGQEWRQMIATPLHYFWALGILLLLMAASYGLSLLTEARTGAVRAWARRVLPG